jgi:hypothetical protein
MKLYDFYPDKEMRWNNRATCEVANLIFKALPSRSLSLDS